MKKQYLSLALAVSILGNTTISHADEFDTVGDLFGLESEENTNTSPIETNKVLSAFISSKIPASMAKNIENAEKVFCYTVDYAKPESNEYTVNDLAIIGSCGELSSEGRSLIRDALLSNNAVFSTTIERCDISPRIMLRYINGIDSTDILLSAPCHSLTFFHGRDLTTFNASPGKAIIEQIVATYSSLKEKFVSPAVLGQMVPNGQVITQGQKEIVRKINSNDSVKKWGNEKQNSQEQSATQKERPAKGWNRLK